MVDSTQRRMIAVAVAVCAFAIGMAGLLNYFKYRATASRIIEQRLTYTGKSIENSIQSSLALGLQFADLTTLPDLLQRQRASDDLIMDIDVFDTDGRPLYSTDAGRRAQTAPAAWLAAARKAGQHDWTVHADEESAVGVALQNNFGLTIGHVALRYSDARVRQAAQAVARDLALNSLAVFAVAATLASLALLAVMRRLGRDMAHGRSGAGRHRRGAGRRRGAPRPLPAGAAAVRHTVRSAEADIADARVQLQRGAGT
jgi:hypothetical protein